MELPNVGKQCEHPTCKQLDFLPYQCKCLKIFCSEHYSQHVQECSAFKKNHKQANLLAKSGMWTCSRPDCKQKSLVPLLCGKCNQHFCISHRHITACFSPDPSIREAAIAKMQKPIEKFHEAKAKVDKKLDESIKAATKTPLRNEMAIKLQLMRIKNRATGQKGIPTTDRVYFNVTKPKTCGGTTHAVFVAKNWSVGRAIDAIADECKVPNRNNIATADKLRLFHKEPIDSRDLNENLSTTLRELLEMKNLIDGQSLQLEFVPA